MNRSIPRLATKSTVETMSIDRQVALSPRVVSSLHRTRQEVVCCHYPGGGRMARFFGWHYRQAGSGTP
ncbi:hypothetical protein Y032_0020g60 [Ancylostoma ceylanicum]|uniref:Uncharacterized protein n=1 Tax=Ancylostoma ceylanicum TaxID=53326 RepID=A0A016V3A8_9BILA|nr:hypothetical protein Y032_0020g60 [Ancylostoma ceylanicum]